MSDILLVEDTASLALVYQEHLRKAGLASDHVDTLKATAARLEQMPPRVVLLDLQLPDGNGLDLLKECGAESPAAFIVITSHGSINTAVEAMRLGAWDFLVKPFSEERLVTTVRNALERSELRRLVAVMQEDLGRERFHGFIGSSLPMQAVYRMVEAVASSQATVFITGESGTGKEVCAEAIHKASPRRAKPFVALNCGAIPHDLMESEIFGHLKGSFTGAIAERKGAAREADGGTLFLDEICEMDLSLQTKLLRFLQTGTVQPVGSARPEKVDIRVLCATNRDPWAEVEAGRFREDLYFRLHVVPIHLPPLRERENDTIEIAEAFIARFAREEGKAFKGIDDDARALLLAHPWRGNVRELQNVMRNVVVLHDGPTVTADMLPPQIARDTVIPAAMPRRRASDKGTAASATEDTGDTRQLWEIERDAIEAAIAAKGGSIPKAAQQLGVSPSTLYRKRESWIAEGKLGPAD
jgi:two-component system, repressor protein LuxO